MKGFILGFVCGAATVCVVSKLIREGKLDALFNDINKFSDKTRQNLKGALDVVQDEVIYAGEVAETKSKQVANVINDLGNKIAQSKRSNSK